MLPIDRCMERIYRPCSPIIQEDHEFLDQFLRLFRRFFFRTSLIEIWTFFHQIFCSEEALRSCLVLPLTDCDGSYTYGRQGSLRIFYPCLYQMTSEDSSIFKRIVGRTVILVLILHLDVKDIKVSCQMFEHRKRKVDA